MKLYIGVDLGTSAVKLLLMDGEGQIKNVVSKEYPLEFPQPGWSQQNPEDWRKAVLASAREHVLMHTALSDRDRQVYRAYALEGEDIAKVAKRFGLSRNSVSQIKTRIEKRIVAAGREMIAKEEA